ncbi:MAG TPA: tRNA lysidine(34) synthetase TilS [Longimicrobiaceae bacterium]|nr:tRNA lysidine(34) synthetase TilS [Longimicrobiaceae bacterium]
MPRTPPPPLGHRVRQNLETLGVRGTGAHVMVAVSGGVDSVALLHLLRFAAPERELRLSAAHLDHAMRSGSAADACWVAGLCRAWQLPLVSERAAEPPRSEEEARRARYAFLRRAAREVGATHLLTAHHADDQAETVLFRILRGTGVEGLAGIPPSDPSGLVRPLLPFWRTEIEAYAEAQELRWREDPSNRSLDPRRNRIRHELLPWIEERVAPGARRHLVQLAELAREADAEWREIVQPLEQAAYRREGQALVLARSAFRGYGPALGSRMLRSALRALGIVPGQAGTRVALQFITGASSGRELWLPGGIRLLAEFDSVRVERPGTTPPDQPLEIPAPDGDAEAAGSLRIGGGDYRARWRVAPWSGSDGEEGGEDWRVALGLDGLRFPLRLRGWQAGDRIRLAGGTKTLKKLFLERRIPRSRRHRLPLLVDARGRVLWVAGVARSLDAVPQLQREALLLAIVDD